MADARPDTAPEPTSTVDTLAFARTQRARGDVALAAAVLDAALTEPTLQAPATVDLASQAGWLHLERAGLYADAGELQGADSHALAALDLFERATDAAGAATACLQLGDANWQAGHAESAASWWGRARSLADAVGSTALAARALVALALHDLAGGEPEVAEARLDAASDRAGHDVAEALDPTDADAVAAARQMTDAARAAIALVRARRALAARSWGEARLLLAGTVEAAARLEQVELYVDALRLDATLARRLGDPRAAVESLRLAVAACARTGADRLRCVVETELVLALADNESWAEAFELQEREPPPAVAAQPAVHAARLEAFAVLALQAGRREAAEGALADAQALRQRTGDAAAAARTAVLRAETLLARGQLPEADRLAREAQAVATRAGRPDVALDAELVQTRIALARQEPGAAEQAARAVGRAAQVGGVPQQLVALDAHTAALLQAGQARAGVAAAQQMLDLAMAQPLVRLQAKARGRLAHAQLLAGDAPAAVREAQVAAELAARANDGEARVRALLVAGNAWARQGRTDEARIALGHAQQAALGQHRADLAAEAAFELGNALAATHAFREAGQAFGRCLDAAEQAGLTGVAARAWRGVALCRRAAGDVQGATDALQRAVALAEAAGLAGEAAACHIDEAQQLVGQGDLAGAQARLEGLGLAARDCALEPAAVRGDGRALLGRIHAQLGRPREAAEVLQQAVADLREAGEPRSLGAALLLAGQVEGLLGHGEACGALLGEALLVTAQHGLPEQQVVRRVIERMQAQAEPH